MQKNNIVKTLFEYIMGSITVYMNSMSFYINTNDEFLFIALFTIPFIVLTTYAIYNINNID